MATRTFPSYRLYRDTRNRWRWRYERDRNEPLAVSPDSYASREECESMVRQLRSPAEVPLWIDTRDLIDATT